MSRFKEYTYPRDGSTNIIILGDAGVNYYLNKTDKKVKQQLQDSGYQFFLVRGNHEERPEKLGTVSWHRDNLVNGVLGTEEEFPAIHYFVDGGFYTIDGHRTLVIGGAYSIDKYYRLQKGYPYQWFEREQLNEFERSVISDKVKGEEFDFVLSHTCPRSFEPTDLFIPGVDQATVDKSMEDWLDEIKTTIKYKIWLFGHFHADRIEKKFIEQYYKRNDTLQNIWERWTVAEAPPWWIPKSPMYYV